MSKVGPNSVEGWKANQLATNFVAMEPIWAEKFHSSLLSSPSSYVI